MKTNLEKLENNHKPANSNHGGARPGSGRKKGGKNKDVISRELALKQFRDKVAAVSDQLFVTQFTMARGEQHLFHVKWIGKGAKRRKEVDVVSDVETIKLYLLGEFDQDDDDNYYFISTKAANNQALDSLLNRTFGTAQQSIDLTSDSKPLPAPIYGGLSVADRPATGSRRN